MISLYTRTPSCRKECFRPKIGFTSMEPFKIFLLIFICFISGFTLWTLTASFLRVRQSRSSWLQTTGHVTSFGINYGTPIISYEYDVQGKVFTGNKFTPGPLVTYPNGTSFPKSFYLNESGQLRFSPGSAVAVFYNPDNPGDSALVREMPSGKGLLLVLPLIAFFVAIYVHPEWFTAHLNVLIPSGALVAGLVSFIYGCTWIRRHWKTRSFPSVKGQLLKAEAVYSGGGGSSGNSGGYTVSVEFEYEVNGCRYRSQQLRDLSLTILKSRLQDAQLQAEQLQSEPSPEVFYDPSAPWDGFLLRTNLLGSVSPILLSIPFLGLGVLFLIHNFCGSR
jgi:hypothetical protein